MISKLPIGFSIHGPKELAQQILGKNLLNLDLISLAPSHRYPWIVVVGLRSAQRNLFALLFLF
jgi:hypothetical protein